MGTWGPGLYANDLAKDLKATIASVIKLPFASSELVKLLEESYPDQSHDEDDEDFTSFWFVLADQFHKQGIEDKKLYQRAIDILDSGQDLACPERLEMSSSDRRQREKTLAELRERLTTRPASKARKTLSKPQPLVMNLGDLVLYPVFSRNHCYNPYSSGPKRQPDAWGAACIVKCGLVFGYLAFYYPLVLVPRFDWADKPSAAMLFASRKWELRRPGTCSKAHFGRLELEIIDRVTLDPKKVAATFPKMEDGRYEAVNDISLANFLGPSHSVAGKLDRLEKIMK